MREANEEKIAVCSAARNSSTLKNYISKLELHRESLKNSHYFLFLRKFITKRSSLNYWV